MIADDLLQRAKASAQSAYCAHEMSATVLDGMCAHVEDVLAEFGIRAHADWAVRRSDTGTFLVTLHVHEAAQEIELELHR